jgi:hypothetical protein
VLNALLALGNRSDLWHEVWREPALSLLRELPY